MTRKGRIYRSIATIACFVSLVWGCAEAEPDDAQSVNASIDGSDGQGAPQVRYLSPIRHLVRASMVLRGMRPSLDELKAVRDDAAALPGIVQKYVDSPEFGATVRDVENETLWMRSEHTGDRFPAQSKKLGVAEFDLNREMFEGPLRLIEDIVMNDRPYSDIVKADYLMLTKAGHGVFTGAEPFDDKGPTWQRIKYKDGRPTNGILSDPVFFYRYESNAINHNRGRANAISRSLLCYNFLENDVVLDVAVDLGDESAVADAAAEVPGCVSCHQALDPMASFLFGIQTNFRPSNTGFPMPYWRPKSVGQWKSKIKRPPGYFGTPSKTQDDLGDMIAKDPRFAACTAKRYVAFFTQTQLRNVDMDVAARFTDAFVAAKLDIKKLAVAIVLSDEFRASHADDDPTAKSLNGLHKARPEQLERLFGRLTGLNWRTRISAKSGTINLLTTDHYGFRVLAGGIDSHSVLTATHTMSATSSLVLRALATDAATLVVTHDLAKKKADERRLLKALGPTEFGAEADVRKQLADLHLQLFGEDVTAAGKEVDESWALFKGALDLSKKPDRAWLITLTALFQDAQIAYY